MSNLDWNLEDIFHNKEEFENAKNELENKIKIVESYKGTLGKSAENIYNCYKANCEALEIHEKLYAYSMLKYHQNMADTERIKLYKEIESLTEDFSTRIAFIEPEITKIDEKIIEKYLKENTKLQEFEKSLKDILKEKKHILSEELETALSKYSEVFNASENTYDTFTNTEFDYPNIIDENGKELKMTDGLYSKYMKSSKEKIRKQAFESMYSLYKKHINTITELYLTRVKARTISSKLRNYKSSLEAATNTDDSSVKVYDVLLKEMNKNLYLNHEYIKLKNKLIGKEKMHMYDVYVNPLSVENENVEYEEAKKIVLEALKPMGEEYVNTLKKAFENRWIDVMEKENKIGGAYSMGVYGVHPFVLLNYINSSRDVSTIAHELGHAMHSYYANNSKNIINANYTIMVAEVASTVNETILADYLINKETDKKKKAALINSQLDDIRATLVRQTMFAEFEKIVHERTEKGESLSSDELNNIYFDLVKKYFGEDCVFDEEIKYEWARIPHFYSCFYVYKYATGITAAIAIASKILKGEPGYVEEYKKMLSLGGSKGSLELLKMVDVDLEKEETYEIAFNYFKEKLEELKKLI